MIFSVNSQQLAAALRPLNKVTPTKATIPILSYVLIEATGSSLRLSATDLDVSLSLSCAAEVSQPGSIALPAATLLRMVEQFTDAPVTIETEGKTEAKTGDKKGSNPGVRVTCGAFTSRLQTLAAEDFPTLAQPDCVQPDGAAPITLPGATLAALIAKVRYAATTDDTRYFMHGALLKLAGGTLTLVATDGHRVSVATAAGVVGADVSTIIPAKTLALLATFSTGDITFTVAENHLFFSDGDQLANNGRLFTSRKIDGNFPNWERTLPKDHDKTLTVDRAALAAALHRVSVSASQNRSTSIAMSEGVVTISAKSVEVGDADEQMVAHYVGDPLTFSIDWRYLLEFLDAAEGATIALTAKDALTAISLTDGPITSGSASFLNVISLMRK